jgi:two-component system sporulation sensor kinase B
MNNPVLQFADGFYWDLRDIPLILAFMYGCLRGGLTAAGISLLLQLNYGTTVCAETALFHLAGVVPAVYTARHFFTFHLRRKLTLTVLYALFAVAAMSLGLLYAHFFQNGNMLREGSYLFALQLLSIACVQVAALLALVVWAEHMMETHHLRLEMHRTEKMQHISELAASVAHEIRNPLQVTRGFLQLSMKDAAGNLQRYLSTAMDELDRAENIISEFLLFAKPHLAKSAAFSISDSLQQAVTMMEPYAHMAGAELALHCAPGLYIVGDESKLKQGVVNLIKNGIESISGSGRVEVRAFAEGGSVIVRITDNGAGMTKEQMNRLGVPFYSTKTKGTGLGLMVTIRLIEAMRGKMQFRSEPGKGSEVTVSFPQAEQPPEEPERPA